VALGEERGASGGDVTTLDLQVERRTPTRRKKKRNKKGRRGVMNTEKKRNRRK